METLHDRALKERYMRQLDIGRYFTKTPEDFLLLHYRPGELLTSSYTPNKYLQFVAEGNLLLYDMPDENSTIMLQTTFHEVRLLGEMEMLDSMFVPFFVEARSDVYTLAIHMDQYRERLLNDPVFLRHIALTLAEKLSNAVRYAGYIPLRTRVETSLRNAEVGQRFRDIAKLAKRMGVSNRQLLRVLKELCDEGWLRHESKGVYVVLRNE